MKSIFNIFDPSTSNYFSLNWIMISMPILFNLSNFWSIPFHLNMFIMKMLMFMDNELNIILKNKINKIIFTSIFFFIMMTNFTGLYPYIFTSSSHLTFNFSLALSLWLSFMIMGWLYNCMHMFTHQVPMGTPNILMPFMVLIEFISNIIRPLTLSVRLTANMIAGHLLLTLISNNGIKLLFIFSWFLILFQTLLMILEMSVALIQSYVFIILLSLYSQET